MQSVSDILSAIASGAQTAAGAVDACFNAIERSEADIGAFTALANRVEAVAGAKRASGPLAGIAVGIKDIFDTHDFPTGYGSPIYEGHRPAADASIVAMLRAAGATVIGKTVTTEFAFFHPGKTRNPHNRAHTPGGSSSGSAAAIAAGMIPAAIGSQTGGSVIRPAAFCGIAGFKPDFAMVPVTGMKAFAPSLDTVGFFAASVADVARFAAIATGRPLDSGIAQPPRIGLLRTREWDQADAEMREAVETAAQIAEQSGATVVEIEEPVELAEARQAHRTIQDFEAAQSLFDEFERHREKLSATLCATLEAGREIAPQACDDACATVPRALAVLDDIFNDIDVFLTPSAPGAAPYGLEATGDPLFNKLWTMTGAPCVNVPGLNDKNGLPLGVQIVSGRGRSVLALGAATWFETALKTAISDGNSTPANNK